MQSLRKRVIIRFAIRFKPNRFIWRVSIQRIISRINRSNWIRIYFACSQINSTSSSTNGAKSTVVNLSTPVVVIAERKNDGIGHQSSVVVSPQPKSSSQIADVSNNGVVNDNSSHQCPKSNKSKDFLQHHQGPARHTAMLYRQIKNVVGF